MRFKIDNETICNLRNWFYNYVNTFKYHSSESQQNIDIKREHTERVCKEIIIIGKKLGLNNNEMNLAEIIALFHDIGRFEQYDRYKTFSDQKSENHAEMGIKILERNDVLGMMEERLQKLIFCAIRYHNLPLLPEEETDICLFYSRLIRDADKLDILRVITNYYHRKDSARNVALELELPDTRGISKKVYNALMNKHIVDIRHVKNLNDIKLLQAGWIYDINFNPTLECIKELQYVDLIRNVLPESRKIDQIFNLINIHFNSNIDQPSEEIPR